LDDWVVVVVIVQNLHRLWRRDEQ